MLCLTLPDVDDSQSGVARRYHHAIGLAGAHELKASHLASRREFACSVLAFYLLDVFQFLFLRVVYMHFTVSKASDESMTAMTELKGCDEVVRQLPVDHLLLRDAPDSDLLVKASSSNACRSINPEHS